MTLEQTCLNIRQEIFKMIVKRKSGHIGGSLSCVEILVALYHGGILKHHPDNPAWEERDRLIFSKAHASEVLYAVLADRGFFPKEWLNGVDQSGTLLGTHASTSVPGIEWSGGSLGHGLSVACGIALGALKQGQKHTIYCVLGEGDLFEGSTLEAMDFAARHHLTNLCAIVDSNKEVTLEQHLNLNAAAKFFACGWHQMNADGHAVQTIIQELQNFSMLHHAPKVLICHTIKGKGLSFAEEGGFHHKVPSATQIEVGKKELGLI